MMIAMGKSLPSRRLPWPLGKALSRPEGETRVVSHYFGFRHQRRADINAMTQSGREWRKIKNRIYDVVIPVDEHRVRRIHDH